jgi:hypothetical protein
MGEVRELDTRKNALRPLAGARMSRSSVAEQRLPGGDLVSVYLYVFELLLSLFLRLRILLLLSISSRCDSLTSRGASTVMQRPRHLAESPTDRMERWQYAQSMLLPSAHLSLLVNLNKYLAFYILPSVDEISDDANVGGPR